MRPPEGSIQPNWETWNRRASSLGEALKLPQGIGPARLPFQQLDAERNCWCRLSDRRAHAILRGAVNMARSQKDSRKGRRLPRRFALEMQTRRRPRQRRTKRQQLI